VVEDSENCNINNCIMLFVEPLRLMRLRNISYRPMIHMYVANALGKIGTSEALDALKQFKANSNSKVETV
jgi:hypothetical protein